MLKDLKYAIYKRVKLQYNTSLGITIWMSPFFLPRQYCIKVIKINYEQSNKVFVFVFFEKK